MFEDLSVARLQLHEGECAEETCADDSGLRMAEHADFIFKTAEIDSGFSSYGGVHRTEQGSGHIDVAHSALECGCHKAPEVGDHAAPEVHHHGAPCGSGIAERPP